MEAHPDSRKNSRSRRRKLLAAGAGLLLAAAAGFRQWALPYLVPLPEAELAKRAPARIYSGCRGETLHCRPGSDHQWRFPVRLDALPEHLIRITLGVEDRNFFRHDGVDHAAALRALRQLLTRGRIVSGASTVTMQLIAMADLRPRSWFNKLRQMETARGWEKRRSKREILEDYFNFLPYGGRIYGIEAAAQYYFGRPARKLNFAECVLLAGIPQRPSRLRPDRHPEAARKRQRAVLDLLVRNNVLPPDEADRIYRDEPLRYRDFTLPFPERAADPQYFDLVEALAPRPLPDRVRTALDPELQALAKHTLREAKQPFPAIRDGAMAVIENRTGKLRALVGTLDFSAPGDGQVNAAVARRSPGSALKPFLFGEAIDGGMLTADTVLTDAALGYSGYRPGNFDGIFRGQVSAAEALADSLNTPAVRLLEQVGETRMLETLARFRVSGPEFPRRRPGLALALGGVETDLVNLANAYAAIASGGLLRPLRLLENDPESEPVRVWTPGVAEMIGSMLRLRPLPGAAGLDAAWKTGTSNGNRDAWCFAFTPEWTVGVWFGNKSGAPAPDLVGVAVAAPAAGAMLQALHRTMPPSPPPEERSLPTELCLRSGLKPGPSCAARFPGRTIRNIPLAACPLCRGENTGSRQPPTRILSPSAGSYCAAPGGGFRFRLAAQPARFHLYIDNRYRGVAADGEELVLPVGEHRLLLRGEGRYAPTELRLNVLPPPVP